MKSSFTSKSKFTVKKMFVVEKHERNNKKKE